MRVLQGGRFGDLPCVRRAVSVGGQVRLVPAFIERVVCPQVPQNVLRVFQSIRARACAKMAAERTRYVRPATRIGPKTKDRNGKR